MWDEEPQPKKAIIWDILGVLERTEMGNGLTVSEIRQALAGRSGAKGRKVPTDKTILADLRMLQRHSRYLIRPVMSPDREAYAALPFDKRIHYGWYLGNRSDADRDDAQYVSDGQIRILVDAIRSLPADDETRNVLLDALQEMADSKASVSIREAAHLSVVGKHLLDKAAFLVVGDVLKAIEKGNVVTFRYCDYDERGCLVARRGKRGPKIYEVLPCCMTYKAGIYYLVGDLVSVNGVSQAETSIRIFAIRRITKLQVHECSMAPLSESRLAEARQFNAERYLRNIPYAYHESSESLCLDVSSKGLNSFFEWFDEAESVCRNSKTGRYIVKFRSAPTPVSWWVMQFSGSGDVRVAQKGKLAKLVAENCRMLYRILCELQDPVKR